MLNYLTVSDFVIVNISATHLYNGVFDITLTWQGKIRIPGKTLSTESALPACQKTVYQMNEVFYDNQKLPMSDIVGLE